MTLQLRLIQNAGGDPEASTLQILARGPPIPFVSATRIHDLFCSEIVDAEFPCLHGFGVSGVDLRGTHEHVPRVFFTCTT